MTEIPEHLRKRAEEARRKVAGETTKTQQHCWHDDAIVLTSNPPQFPQTCCNCGGKRVKTSRPVPHPGHGPYVASYKTETIYRGGDHPCDPEQVTQEW